MGPAAPIIAIAATVISTAVSVVGGIMQSNAQASQQQAAYDQQARQEQMRAEQARMQYDRQRQQAEAQAEMQRQQDQEQRQLAELKKAEINRAASVARGRQAALAGAAGVEVDSGSILDNLATTSFFEGLDLYNIDYTKDRNSQIIRANIQNLENEGVWYGQTGNYLSNFYTANADYYRQVGAYTANATRTSGLIKAAGSLFGAASSMMGGFGGGGGAGDINTAASIAYGSPRPAMQFNGGGLLGGGV